MLGKRRVAWALRLLVTDALALVVSFGVAYALRVLDPALPVAILGGDEYDGWRIESTLPGLPFTAFYQRHEIGARELALAGAEIALHSDPFPILKFPGLDLTLGAARILDEPLRGETKWWLAARWRP